MQDGIEAESQGRKPDEADGNAPEYRANPLL